MTGTRFVVSLQNRASFLYSTSFQVCQGDYQTQFRRSSMVPRILNISSQLCQILAIIFFQNKCAVNRLNLNYALSGSFTPLFLLLKQDFSPFSDKLDYNSTLHTIVGPNLLIIIIRWFWPYVAVFGIELRLSIGYGMHLFRELLFSYSFIYLFIVLV